MSEVLRGTWDGPQLLMSQHMKHHLRESFFSFPKCASPKKTQTNVKTRKKKAKAKCRFTVKLTKKWHIFPPALRQEHHICKCWKYILLTSTIWTWRAAMAASEKANWSSSQTSKNSSCVKYSATAWKLLMSASSRHTGSLSLPYLFHGT